MIPAPFFVTHSKLERAQELIRQLARHIAESSVGHLPFPEPIAHMSKDNVALGHVWVVHTAPVPESLPYMVSEIAYNLRGVLDSIIDEILPSKVSLGRRKLGFPFEKNESALNDRLLNSLAGVDEREKALIRALKPYFEGGNSTLCGLDKLATVGRRNVIQLAVSVIPANCFALSDEGGIGVDLSKETVQSDFDGVIPLASVQGSGPGRMSRVAEARAELVFSLKMPFSLKPVLPTLEALFALISNVVKTFEEFAAPRLIAKARTMPRKSHVIAVIGARGHGVKHLDRFLTLGCQIAYVCDVDSDVAAAAASRVENATGYRPKVVSDMRVALADPAVEAVSIATPHHWHALATIWALRAGKHVYVEKPLAHTFGEGESIVAAAVKYGKIVQCGTQLRSNRSLRAAAEYMAAGKLGAVDIVHCIVFKPRPPTSKVPTKLPESVDYNLWCGPASDALPTRGNFHYAWHWFWEYGNGALGNNGVHRIDAARIGLNLKGLGDVAFSFGGRFGPDDGGETPNTQVAVHRFGSTWIVQEVRGLPTRAWKGVSNGIIFYGSEGMIKYEGGSAMLFDSTGKFISKFGGKQEDHYADFLMAIESNVRQVAGVVSEGHVSSALCHFGNISYRVGKPAPDSEIAAALDSIGAPAFVHETLARIRQHLLENGEARMMILGRPLKIDVDAGVIAGDAEAAALLRRKHDRPPFIVPAPEDV